MSQPRLGSRVPTTQSQLLRIPGSPSYPFAPFFSFPYGLKGDLAVSQVPRRSRHKAPKTLTGLRALPKIKAYDVVCLHFCQARHTQSKQDTATPTTQAAFGPHSRRLTFHFTVLCKEFIHVMILLLSSYQLSTKHAVALPPPSSSTLSLLRRRIEGPARATVLCALGRIACLLESGRS